MKHPLKTKTATLFMSVFLITSCSSAQNTDDKTTDQNRPPRGERKMPTVDEIFIQMDANKDGKLAESEVKGPLKNDFSRIDTDGDKFITKEELNKAPKPKGGRPPKGQNRP